MNNFAILAIKTKPRHDPNATCTDYILALPYSTFKHPQSRSPNLPVFAPYPNARIENTPGSKHPATCKKCRLWLKN